MGTGTTSGIIIGTGSKGRHEVLVCVIHEVLVTVGSYIVVPPREMVVGRTVILGRVVMMMGLVVIGRVVTIIGRVVMTLGGRVVLGSLGLISHGGVVLGPRGFGTIVGLCVCHGGIDVRGVCQGIPRGSCVGCCLNGFALEVVRGMGALGVDVGRKLSLNGVLRVGTGRVIGRREDGVENSPRVGVSRVLN
jgi:hypothetical protein